LFLNTICKSSNPHNGILLISISVYTGIYLILFAVGKTESLAQQAKNK
jgi:hypothetical protein